jgi:hypothetical protein
MFVSRGLVGPKVHRNPSAPTGKQVNIPVPCVQRRKAPDASGYVERGCHPVEASKPGEYRNGENRANV